MKMKPFVAHYLNKYPGGTVDSDADTYLRAYDSKGKLRVVLADGAGSVQDRSKLAGAPDCHDMAPIPKDCRVFCDRAEGVELHQEAESRKEVAKAVAEKFGGRVPSVAEICGDQFHGSNKFVDEFRAQEWMENGSAPAANKAKKSKK